MAAPEAGDLVRADGGPVVPNEEQQYNRWMRMARGVPDLRNAAMQLIAIGYQGGLMAADQYGGRRYDQRPRPMRAVSCVQSKCALCNKAVLVDLINYQPEACGLRVCDEDCAHSSRKPLVFHRQCIVDHMVNNHMDVFKVACKQCEKTVCIKRELAIKPSQLPATLWRLTAWLFSKLVFWPIVCYPFMHLLFWLCAVIMWWAEEEEAEWPGLPGSQILKIETTNYDLSAGEPVLLDTWQLKWLASIIFGYTMSSMVGLAAWFFRLVMPQSLKNALNWRRTGFSYTG